MWTKSMTLLLVFAFVTPIAGQPGADADVWRTFAQRLEVGSRIKLQLRDGRGMGPGKAIAIGVAAGVGAFLGILLLIVASID